MLQNKEINNPNAIEFYVCKKIRNCKPQQLDYEAMSILATLCSSNNFEIKKEDKPFLFQVIEKRISCFQFVINDQRLILFLTLISETPGSAVLYLWYLQWWSANHDYKEINLELFCERIFPMGFPSKNDLHEIWEGQKVNRQSGSDNLVDYASTAGVSLKFLEYPTA